MLGLILCIFSCSSYISLVNATLDRGKEERPAKYRWHENSDCRYHCRTARIVGSCRLDSVLQFNHVSDQ